MLWSDEGLFTVEDARSRMGGSSLSGWTPEDGFLDAWAFLKFLWGKHSAFFLDAAPDSVDTYMFLFFGVLLLYAAGVLSRVTGLIAWLMMSSVYNHNTLYMEGTDTVYRSFWFILLFARTGAAWSVDNLVRCWWLRRRGRLQEVGLPPSPGRRPVYALIPELAALPDDGPADRHLHQHRHGQDRQRLGERRRPLLLAQPRPLLSLRAVDADGLRQRSAPPCSR
jgi:hypothetical protein